MTKKRVIVGISGGVDSSVAAYLLLQKGYAVEGLFMKNWENDDDSEYCSSATDLKDAQSVCQTLGIKLHTVNFAKEYWDNVFNYFLEEYAAGRTPNPDILCNKEIKFKAFLDYALYLGADYIATGHYARVLKSISSLGNETYNLAKGLDNNKDQSYFLYQVPAKALSKTIFPIGDIEKSEVRKIAANLGLATAKKKDSTGICFIGERKFKDFLAKYLPAKPGNIKTESGEVLGQHDGLMYYTIGQRQGIGIGGIKNSNEEPWYVLEKEITTNTLIVGQGTDNKKLFSKLVYASKLHWLNEAPKVNNNLWAKVRYRQTDKSCKIVQLDDKMLTVEFIEEQRAVTPGQSLVIYDGDICMGGGVIERTDR